MTKNWSFILQEFALYVKFEDQKFALKCNSLPRQIAMYNLIIRCKFCFKNI